MAEITQDLERNNPELLDMASKWAKDVGNFPEIMLGFGMFYRLLIVEFPAAARQSLLAPLPRVTPETRDLIVSQIDEKGAEAFTMEAVEDLEQDNPELLQMADNFASRQSNYLGVMQGFALFYKSLVIQSSADRKRLH